MIDFIIGKTRIGYVLWCGDKLGGYEVESGIKTKKDALKARSRWRRKWYGIRPKERAETINLIVYYCRTFSN